MSLLDRLFGKKSNDSGSSGTIYRRITLKAPLVIQAPRLGIVNLLKEEGENMAEADKEVLAPLFSSFFENDLEPPVCDVLLLYARIAADGRIEGTSDGLRTLIAKSQAPIFIVASENDGGAYIAASNQVGEGRANLVMTIERRGPVFANFFHELFSKMFAGTTMPVAWVQLAPQIPGANQENAPSTIFAAEISHIVLRK